MGFLHYITTMSKRLPYFQFEPAEYTSGDIITCSYAAQGVFAHLKALYWQRNCQLTLVKANKIIREDDLINELITEGVVKIDGDNIIINFLDEQLEEITKSKKRLSEAGKKGAEVKAALLAEKQATLKLPLSPAKATLQQLDKIRLDKIKEDNKILDNKSGLVPPLDVPVIDLSKIPPIEVFIAYANEQAHKVGLTLDLVKVKLKYNSWVSNGWETGGDKPRKIKNWKSTVNNTLIYLVLETKPEDKPFKYQR